MSSSIVRPLVPAELGDFWEIVVLAGSDGYYPKEKEKRVKWFERLVEASGSPFYYGAFRDGKMAGGMAIDSFEINVRSAMVRLSSVGMVHTDMLHKKEKVCKDMMEYFIQSNREKGVSLLTLTPFRPDFYKQMGFGYGSCLYQYRIPPASFPNKGSRECLSYIGMERMQDYLACVDRIVRKTHGMIKSFWTISGPFRDGHRVLAYEQNGEIGGILAFSFGGAREMVIDALLYEDTRALRAFCAFLHAQSDQFDRIAFSTPDPHFYYILHDPTDGLKNLECCASIIHNMFRVIDVPGIFNELRGVNFNDQSAVIEIAVRDSFCPQNAGSTFVAFADGRPRVSDAQSVDAKIDLDISDFSSLLMGAIDVRTLCRLGLAEIQSERELALLDRIFTFGQMPLTTGGL